MKIGVCSGVENAEIIKSAGYDYVEENLSRIATMSEDDFEKTLTRYKEVDIPVLCTNCFFPGGVTLFDKETEYFKPYVQKALYRAYKLGVSTVVLGSGAARRIPEGLPVQVAEEKFVKLLKMIADIAEPYSISIAIEPLRFLETNFINMVNEGVRMAKLTEKANVGALVDFFHYYLNNDDSLPSASGYLNHAHIARPHISRAMPKPEDLPILKEWKALLDEIGYDGNLSLEGNFEDFEADIKATLPLVKIFK